MKYFRIFIITIITSIPHAFACAPPLPPTDSSGGVAQVSSLPLLRLLTNTLGPDCQVYPTPFWVWEIQFRNGFSIPIIFVILIFVVTLFSGVLYYVRTNKKII